MHKAFHKIEHLVDKLIPYIVVVLLGVIIITFFFPDIAEQYHTLILIADYTIISFFVVDLTFKFIRVRKIKKFVRMYWLDIIAVFPFYLFLRALEEVVLLYRISEITRDSQPLLHVGTKIGEISMVEKDAQLLIMEAEKAGKLSRSKFALRFFRPLSRIPRVLKILPYYEKTTGEHHPHDMEKRKSRKRRSR